MVLKNKIQKFLVCGFILTASCFAGNNVEILKGKYATSLSDSGTIYYFFLTLKENEYKSEFFYEDETVWDCNGKYLIQDSLLILSSNSCIYRRTEEPQKTHNVNNDTLKIRNIKKESFELFLKKETGEGIPFEKWIILKLKKPALKK
jgi:hypothetical protein